MKAYRRARGSSARQLAALLLVLSWAGLAATPASAQPGVSCWELADEYLGAGRGDAVAGFLQWSERELESRCGFEDAPAELRAKAAVALLHTEAGLRKLVFGATRPEVRVVNDSLSEREVHFRTAFQLVDAVYRQAKNEQDARFLEFCRRWYVQVFHAGGGLLRRTAEIRFADDPEVAVLLGAWEVQMMGPEVNDGPAQRLPGLYGGTMLASSHGRFAADSAAKAERWFRRALASDPRFYMARLHLGRLMFTLDRNTEARSELERALLEADSADDPFATYLAALFLGELYEAADQTDLALPMYRRAAMISPGGQAAALALGRLLISQGNAADGWAQIRAMLESNRDASGRSRDPWQYFRYSRGAIWDSDRRIADMRLLVQG